MKKISLIYIVTLIGIISFVLIGCSEKKSELSQDEMQAQLNTETTTIALKEEPIATPAQTELTTSEISQVAESAVTTLSKPSAEEIQTALKNAGYYTGNIDGKIGPKSKKAIEDFQEANSLVVDGRVGSKTWAKLQGHLNTAPAQQTGD